MEVDLFVIGGGINGCAIAADAAGRGLSVALCEKDDLAFATSSASSKLIHGGLRYLEQYDFKLVRQSLIEQSILMNKAPFLIQPLKFVIPHDTYMRSGMMMRLGLFVYDHLYWHRKLPRSRKVNLRRKFEGDALKGDHQFGFSYFDCFTDDARLVILNAIAAREKGAHILTRTRCESLERFQGYWIATLKDRLRERILKIKAKAIVNAAGPWTWDVVEHIAKINSPCKIRLVLGSHIVIPKLYEGKHAYTLLNPDGRTVFAIPFKKTFTLVGTTEVDYQGDPDQAAISTPEIHYLCETINRYFSKQVQTEDIVWSYSGVRPLYDDHSNSLSQISRDYHLDLNTDKEQAPILSVFGGKITTHRLLSENAVNQLRPFFPEMGKTWTVLAKLPGSDAETNDIEIFVQDLEKKYNWMPVHILYRYAKLYGNLCHAFLSDCRSLDDMGRHFGAGLYERELAYQVRNEWVQRVDDVLWRRTKLGLYMSPEQVNTLKDFL